MQIEISEDGFINMLNSVNGGNTIERLDSEMIKGLQACFDHGGKSVITLKVTMSRTRGMEIAANVTPEVSAKHPQEPDITGTMFVTPGSGLSAHYQEQQGLDLTPTDRPAGPELVPFKRENDDRG